MESASWPALAAACVAVLLAGCAAAPGSAPPPTSSPAVSSIACPQVDDAPLPAECIPYDPQALMDANERYRDRLPVHPESLAAFEAVRADIAEAIEELQGRDAVTADAVTAVMIEAGFPQGDRDSVTAWEDDGVVTFNGVGPVGGCVFGTASATDFEIEIQGVIMDGGCHPATGH